MYLYFGFSMPAAISVYFMANSVLGMGQEFITAKMLKKDYEEAREKQRLRELEEKEEEKREVKWIQRLSLCDCGCPRHFI